MLLKTMRRVRKIEARHDALLKHIVRLTSGWMSGRKGAIRQNGFAQAVQVLPDLLIEQPLLLAS